jgi:starch synthase
VWNPATDAALATRYDAEDPSGKVRCRGALVRQLGLAVEDGAPIVASVGRLVHQKGIDALTQAIPKLLRSTDCAFVVIGDGDPSAASELEAVVEKSHGRLVFVRAGSETDVHRALAGADFALVPSRYEPCGLVQLYAQRYGALPIAHATGGLIDTIVDCDARLETGTGFLFEGVSGPSIVRAVERAVAARGENHGRRWNELVKRVMRLDRGWDRPARRYEQVYKGLVR